MKRILALLLVMSLCMCFNTPAEATATKEKPILIDEDGFITSIKTLYEALESLYSDNQSEFFLDGHTKMGISDKESLGIDFGDAKTFIRPFPAYKLLTEDGSTLTEYPDSEKDSFSLILIAGADVFEGFDMYEAIKKEACALLYLLNEDCYNYREAEQLFQKIEDAKGTYVQIGPIEYCIDPEVWLGSGNKFGISFYAREIKSYSLSSKEAK